MNKIYGYILLVVICLSVNFGYFEYRLNKSNNDSVLALQKISKQLSSVNKFVNTQIDLDYLIVDFKISQDDFNQNLLKVNCIHSQALSEILTRLK